MRSYGAGTDLTCCPALSLGAGWFEVLMSRHRISTSRFLKLTLAFCVSTAAWAGTFGKVVSVGGQASDLALDEARGVLYVANFTANRIEVMSLADHSIQRSMNVAAQPASLALSPDGKYLVITHYGNVQAPGTPNNALTVIDLANNSRQTFGMGSAPPRRSVRNRQPCLMATTTEFILFDPAAGAYESCRYRERFDSKDSASRSRNVVSQIVATSMAVSADGVVIYGLRTSFNSGMTPTVSFCRPTSTPRVRRSDHARRP